MAKAKNEDDFTVLRVLKSTLPKLRKLHARRVEASGGEKEPMYVTLDNVIDTELSKPSEK